LKLNLKAIIAGWSNMLHPTEEQIRLAKERAAICEKCKHAKQSNVTMILPSGKIKEVETLICDVCKCPLKALLFQNKKKCELNYWKA